MGMFVFYEKEIMSDGTDKLNEYKQRHKEWRDISVTQLSNVNNILITLSTGLLALGINSNTKSSGFSCAEKISFILLVISICYGTAVLFSRLYDFRISRHLALYRKRFYEKQSRKKFRDDDLGDFDCCQRIKTFLQILFCKIEFISQTDIENSNSIQDTAKKFRSLRKKADVLGNATWIWIKYQVLFFLMSAILYFITQLFKF